MLARFKHAEPVRRLGVVLLVIAGVVTLVGSLDQHPGLDPFTFIKKTFGDFYTNVGTELASIAITVLIIDRLHHHHDDENEREALILQMGSPDHSFAIEAVRILAAKNWLKNGALANAHLTHADLEGANLSGANLRGACLLGARLLAASFFELESAGEDAVPAQFDQHTQIESSALEDLMPVQRELVAKALGQAND